MNRRRFHQCLLATLATPLLPALAVAEIEEGRDWRAIAPPQPPEDARGIEVLEFFSYGCPHCGKLNPHLLEWSENLPADVHLRRQPVTFGRAAWEHLARLYFALELSGDLKRLDQQVFDAIGTERKNLFSENAILDWLKTRAVDTEAFRKLFNGFAVAHATARANALAERYRIDAVPTIVVAGRYAVLGRAAKTHADLLRIADALIAKTRDAGAAGA